MSKKVFEVKHYDFPKQVKFLDLGDTGSDEPIWIGGIAIGDQIVCGCCGVCVDIQYLFDDWNEYGKDEHPDIETPLEEYDYWVDISESIVGE